ncbi:protein kinase [Paraburkholderia sp. CNPSo 3157]|uniref:Protein kinase n=1 Tax=Paraburkholderia franconis TaxID=2654983 RepID=A0A7X1NG55_9BURK|nr:protein kinase [Paraburkholderia franconis]
MDPLFKERLTTATDATSATSGASDGGARPLPAGHRLGDFELDAVLGIGGFGIVYRAFDRTLQRAVAVKEYMPSLLARRGGDFTVCLRAERFAAAFDSGRAAFLNEARLLAQFDHPGLVKVLQFWQSHGTAYMVMPFYEGPTLKQRAAKHGPMSEGELLNLVAALLGALDTLHRAQCFHRDISLDNVLIPSDGKPVLLDFGAARKSIGDAVDETSVMLKPGYSPIEQYTDDPAFVQGPWTDIYSLGAVMHAMIVGEPPPAAVVRSIQDAWQPLASRGFAGRERYTLPFLEAVDHALALRTEDRPDSVAAFARLLGLREAGACVYVAGGARDAGVPLLPETRDDAGYKVHEVHKVPHQPAPPPRVPSRASEVPRASDLRDERDGQTDGAMIQGATGLLDGASNEHADPDATVAPPVGDPRPSHASAEQQREIGDHIESGSVSSAPSDNHRMWAADALQRAHSTLARMTRLWSVVAFAMKRSAERVDRRRSVAIAGTLVLIAIACVATYRLFEYAIRAPEPKTVARTAPATAHAPVVTAQHAPPTSPAGGSVPRRSEQLEPTAPATTAPASQSFGAETQARTTHAAVDEQIASAATATDVQTAPTSITSGVDVAQGASASDEHKAPKLVAIRLQVYPWGEVYVDGVRRGVSPPLKTLALAPGQYGIEIRNGQLPPMRRTVRLDPGSGPVNISYRFE